MNDIYDTPCPNPAADRREEAAAYGKALRRFRESPQVQRALLGLKTAHIERQREIRAFWRGVALGVLGGMAILTLAILAMFAL